MTNINRCSKRFQSHFGLILSRNVTAISEITDILSIPFWSDFIILGLLSTLISIHFQSHFGLILSTSVSFQQIDKSIGFQSHFGLILSQRRASCRWFKKLAFNPILVWFYLSTLYASFACSTYLSIPFWSDFIEVLRRQFFRKLSNFQSHFGLILSFESKVMECYVGKTFNPILVWFYLVLWAKWTNWKGCFQSHFGLILSNLKDMLKLANSKDFQSHFGLILSTTPSIELATTKQLSIPFWSDFILFHLFQFRVFQFPFNPILVWFYHRNHDPTLDCQTVFQSHFGLILSNNLLNSLAVIK